MFCELTDSIICVKRDENGKKKKMERGSGF